MTSNHTTDRPVRDIFGEKVSVFLAPQTSENPVSDKKTKHYVRTVAQFLDAGKLYASQVQHVRDIRAKALDAYQRGDMTGYNAMMDEYRTEKARAPFAILQGVCPERKNDSFLSYSRVLCLDVDGVKPTETNALNKWVNDWEQVKHTIAQLPFVSYCALSAGGAGLFILIPIADVSKHEDYFVTLRGIFEDCLSLQVDKQCGNLGRLRFMTYDPAPYVNHAAEVWDTVKPKPQRKQRDTSPRWGMQRNGWDGCSTLSSTDKERVKWCADWCLRHNTDIADAFDDWMRLTAFFAHCWDDPEGNGLYHALSSLSSKYNVGENDRKLTSMGKYHPHPATIHTFYRLCRSHGVPVPDGWSNNTRSSWVPVVTYAPPSNERAMRNEHRANPEKAPKNDIDAPVSAFAVPSGIVTPPPQMSATERNDLDRHRGDVVLLCSTIERMRRDVDGFAALMDGLDLDPCGLNDWMMTPAQAFEVSQNFSNFVTQ